MKKLSVFCLVMVLQTLVAVNTCVGVTYCYTDSTHYSPCTYKDCIIYANYNPDKECYCVRDTNDGFLDESYEGSTCQYARMDDGFPLGEEDGDWCYYPDDDMFPIDEEIKSYEGMDYYYMEYLKGYKACQMKASVYYCVKKDSSSIHEHDPSPANDPNAHGCADALPEYEDMETVEVIVGCKPGYFLNKDFKCQNCPRYNETQKDGEPYEITSNDIQQYSSVGYTNSEIKSNEALKECYFTGTTYHDDRGDYTISNPLGKEERCSVADIATGVGDQNFDWNP